MSKRLIFILFVLPLNLFAAEIQDLGIRGFTCELDLKKYENENSSFLEANKKDSLTFQEVTPIKNGYTPKIRKYTGETITKRFSLDSKDYFTRRKIFIFSAKDDFSIAKAKEINADYGLCVEYDSLSDIDLFRKSSGFNVQVQLGNDAAIELLHVESYPALVTVNGNEIKIEMGDF